MKQVKNKKSNDTFLFFVISIWVFVLSLFILNFFEFVPYYVDGTLSNKEKEELKISEEKQAEEIRRQLEELRQRQERDAVKIYPTRIQIPVFDVDLPVSNPETTDVKE